MQAKFYWLILLLFPTMLPAENTLSIDESLSSVYLEDYMHQWKAGKDFPELDAVIGLPDGLFTPLKNKFLHTPYFEESVWGVCKVEVKKVSGDPIFLLIAKAFHIRLDVYLVDESGKSLKLKREPIKAGNSLPYFKVPLEEGHNYKIYIHINNKGSIGPHPVALVSGSELIKNFNRRSLLNGLYYGLMLLILCVTLFLAFKTGRREILFYSLYLLGSTFYQFLHDGYPYAFIFPDRPDLNPHILSFILNLGIYFGLRLFLAFLKPKQHSLLMFRVGQGLAWLNLIALPFALFDTTNRYLVYLNNYTAAVCIGYLLVCAAILAWKKNKFAKYYLTAYSCLFIGVLFQVISNSGQFGQESAYVGTMKIGLLIEFLLLIYVLVDTIISQFRENQQKALDALQQSHESQMLLLSARVNPHFFFNSLTSIQHFILTNNSLEANRYISKFAKLFRKTFDNSSKSLIPLETELDQLGLYVTLERMRTDDQFDFHQDIDPAIDQEKVMIPNMLLQPFIENAIWHGVRGMDGKGHIQLAFKKQGNLLKVRVEDNGVGRAVVADKNKYRERHKPGGVELTRQRICSHNGLEDEHPAIVFTDLMDEDGNPQGTKVEFELLVQT